MKSFIIFAIWFVAVITFAVMGMTTAMFVTIIFGGLVALSYVFYKAGC